MDKSPYSTNPDSKGHCLFGGGGLNAYRVLRLTQIFCDNFDRVLRLARMICGSFLLLKQQFGNIAQIIKRLSERGGGGQIAILGNATLNPDF